MIGHDERMVIVVMSKGTVRHIFHLGYAVPESGEMDRLQILAESKGMSLYLTELDEYQTYASMYDTLGKL